MYIYIFFLYMYIPGDNLAGWLLVDVLAFKKNRFQKTRLASFLFRSVIFNRTYFIYSAQRHIQFVRLRRLLGGVSAVVLAKCTCHSLREHTSPLGVACLHRILPDSCALKIVALHVGHVWRYRRAVTCPLRTRN